MTDTPARDIFFYGAEWCADCRRSRAFLDARDIPYDYVDLVERPDAVTEVTRRNEGRQVIPTIVFADGTHLAEPSDRELADKLGIAS